MLDFDNCVIGNDILLIDYYFVFCYKGYCLLFLLLVRMIFNGWFIFFLCFRFGFRN